MTPTTTGRKLPPHPTQPDEARGSAQPRYPLHHGLLNKNNSSHNSSVFQENPSMASSSPSLSQSRQTSSDIRRNLYVLGLPFSLTKQELDGLFSRFGTVSHSVILATVDGNSRRRGFVVMSRHEEAVMAMKVLSGTQLNGHTLDVSWAVIQRSKGFLDGGDRATMIDSWSNEIPSAQDSEPSPTPTPTPLVRFCTARPDPCPYSRSTLVVANLPTLLFSHPRDLDPLFRPYGQIKSTAVTASNEHVMTVVVEYDTIVNATEAAKSLQGQVYADRALVVQFASPPDPMPQSNLLPVTHTSKPLPSATPQNMADSLSMPCHRLPSPFFRTPDRPLAPL